MKYFSFGGYGSDAEERPDVLRTGAKRGEAILGKIVPPRDIIVIGDNIRDVQAGKAIGARTVAVSSGPMTYEELAGDRPRSHFPRSLGHPALVLKCSYGLKKTPIPALWTIASFRSVPRPGRYLMFFAVAAGKDQWCPVTGLKSGGQFLFLRLRVKSRILAKGSAISFMETFGDCA